MSGKSDIEQAAEIDAARFATNASTVGSYAHVANKDIVSNYTQKLVEGLSKTCKLGKVHATAGAGIASVGMNGAIAVMQALEGKYADAMGSGAGAAVWTAAAIAGVASLPATLLVNVGAGMASEIATYMGEMMFAETEEARQAGAAKLNQYMQDYFTSPAAPLKLTGHALEILGGTLGGINSMVKDAREGMKDHVADIGEHAKYTNNPDILIYNYALQATDSVLSATVTVIDAAATVLTKTGAALNEAGTQINKGLDEAGTQITTAVQSFLASPKTHTKKPNIDINNTPHVESESTHVAPKAHKEPLPKKDHEKIDAVNDNFQKIATKNLTNNLAAAKEAQQSEKISTREQAYIDLARKEMQKLNPMATKMVDDIIKDLTAAFSATEKDSKLKPEFQTKMKDAGVKTGWAL